MCGDVGGLLLYSIECQIWSVVQNTFPLSSFVKIRIILARLNIGRKAFLIYCGLAPFYDHLLITCW